MKPELQQELYNKYPSLFQNKDKSIQESCMGWGIECGSGWHNIIACVCSLIDSYEQNLARENKEFTPVAFDQVKSKWGGLRLYFSGGDDYIKGIVAMAEEMSYKTCEICGDIGSPNKSGWIATLCGKHKQNNEVIE